LIVWDYGHLTKAAAKFVTDRLVGPAVLRKLSERR